MSFVTGIPQNGQTLGASRDLVRGNLDSLYNTLLVNHRDINLSHPGTHTHADLLAQSVDPNPATTLVSHYSKAVSGVTEWFFQRENSGAVIQMSAGTPTITGTFPNSSGQTFLPGGLILKWGVASFGGGQSGNASFLFGPNNFPNNALTAWASSNSTATGVTATSVGAFTTTGLTVYFSQPVSAAIKIFWFALGN